MANDLHVMVTESRPLPSAFAPETARGPTNRPSLEECLEWRPLEWAPAARAAFRLAARHLVPGAEVMEVGYRSGMMACYLASEFGVRVVGYDVDPWRQDLARGNAARFGLEGQLDFRVCRHEETRSIVGSYDLVFIKSVFSSNVADPDEYRRWLRWSRSVLRPGGALLMLDNGRGSLPVRLYRLCFDHRYIHYCLVDTERLADVRKTFETVQAAHFGRYSPLFAWLPQLHRPVARLEQRCLVATERVNSVSAIFAVRGIGKARSDAT